MFSKFRWMFEKRVEYDGEYCTVITPTVATAKQTGNIKFGVGGKVKFRVKTSISCREYIIPLLCVFSFNTSHSDVTVLSKSLRMMYTPSESVQLFCCYGMLRYTVSRKTTDFYIETKI